ncbi:glycosyltransferase family 2 protein [Candidatus Latescibacterota bacterium]
MKNLPTISVIIPTLNSGRTLDRCLAGIRAQDYPRELVEIVIADAGSIDTTIEIAHKHEVDIIVPNPLKTGEAGKSAAIDASTGDVLALVDSDNIFHDTGYFSKAAHLFEDTTIDSVEPLGWTVDPHDTLVNRYCALLGMNDPLSYFLGNYNRYSYLSRAFTGMKLRSVTETSEAFIVEVDPDTAPTFGANGFMIQRSAIGGLDWKPYYFDIDVFQQAVRAGRNRIGVVKTETHHLFCDTIATFRRKQSRRIRDYYYHSKKNRRTYKYSSVPKSAYVIFVLSTVTFLPLLWQSFRGYRNRPDSAWWFHPLACWITLWEYGWGSLLSLFHTSEYDRKGWKQ